MHKLLKESIMMQAYLNRAKAVSTSYGILLLKSMQTDST